MAKKYPKMEWSAERIARFWDWQSQYPDVYFTNLFGAEIVKSLFSYLNGKGRALDYGCGVGYLVPHLCKIVPEVYGADPSEQSIARTNELLAGVERFKGAYLVEGLRERQLAFDVVVCIEVVKHLDDAALDAVLIDVRGLLTPDGVAIFSTPNNEDLSKSMILCPASGEIFHRWQHLRSWSRNSLSAKLRASGFDIVETIETNMSVSKSKSPIRLLKRLIKRLLFGDPGKPHLVCVVKRSAGDPR